MPCGEVKITSQYDDESAFKPPEMILASLGTCDGLFLKPILKEKEVEWEEFKVSLKGKKAKPPKLFKEIYMHYEIKADIEENKLEKTLEKSHEKCSLMNSLHPDIKINTTFQLKTEEENYNENN